ncbi:MAG: hypothetical protein K6E73_10685 [Bacteroidales bacterium]|nr:hypothetical protein [Bacteroidales bacterium]
MRTIQLYIGSLAAAVLMGGCAARRTMERGGMIAAGSVGQIAVAEGAHSIGTWVSQLDGTMNVTFYDTSKPVDSVTGLCPVLAVATGTMHRRDSATAERDDSIRVAAERRDSLTASATEKTDTETGSAAASAVTSWTGLLWALAALAATIAILLRRFRR